MVDPTPAAAAPVPALGTRYAVRGTLGKGGKATVHLADDRLLTRQVAIKVFRARATTPEALQEQENEAKLIASLNHHALTTLFDAGVDTSDPAHPQIYLVMEYIPGSDLKERLKSGPLPWFQVCWLGRDLAEGLHYLHESGFLHRDIKPANVLLAGKDADVRLRGKLADFGIASLVGSDGGGEYVTGTAAYLAPEQVEGDVATQAADVYSLGLVLLEAATGRVAYPGGVEESAFARLDHDPDVPASLPSRFREILAAMTALDPAARPPLPVVAATFQNMLIDDLVRQRAVPSVTPDQEERARLAALARYDILETPSDTAFDTVTGLAARFLDAPVAVVSIIDADRVWTKSRRGTIIDSLARDTAFCASTDPGTGPWTIPDTHADPRVRENPTVVGAPFVRAYAAAPLVTRDGYTLGSLCVCDVRPRDFDALALRTLEDLARLIMNELDLRLAARRAIFDRD